MRVRLSFLPLHRLPEQRSDIPAAGGQIQLRLLLSGAKAPSTGGSWPLQRRPERVRWGRGGETTGCGAAVRRVSRRPAWPAAARRTGEDGASPPHPPMNTGNFFRLMVFAVGNRISYCELMKIVYCSDNNPYDTSCLIETSRGRHSSVHRAGAMSDLIIPAV